MTSNLDNLEIDFLMLADYAESVGGKLYLMGGGWDRKHIREGQPVSVSFAAGIIVPWNLTNREHRFAVTIEDGEGHPVSKALEGGFNVGRPATSIQGQSFRAIVAGNIQVKSLELGPYSLHLAVGDGVSKSTPFYAVDQKAQ